MSVDSWWSNNCFPMNINWNNCKVLVGLCDWTTIWLFMHINETICHLLLNTCLRRCICKMWMSSAEYVNISPSQRGFNVFVIMFKVFVNGKWIWMIQFVLAVEFLPEYLGTSSLENERNSYMFMLRCSDGIDTATSATTLNNINLPVGRLDNMPTQCHRAHDLRCQHYCAGGDKTWHLRPRWASSAPWWMWWCLFKNNLGVQPFFTIPNVGVWTPCVEIWVRKKI